MLEFDEENKIVKKLLVIKEMFLAASWVGWTESLQPRTLRYEHIQLLCMGQTIEVSFKA